MMNEISEKEFGYDRIILESRKSTVLETISIKTLSDMKQAVSNLKNNKVSSIIDLSDF